MAFGERHKRKIAAPKSAKVATQKQREGPNRIYPFGIPSPSHGLKAAMIEPPSLRPLTIMFRGIFEKMLTKLNIQQKGLAAAYRRVLLIFMHGDCALQSTKPSRYAVFFLQLPEMAHC